LFAAVTSLLQSRAAWTSYFWHMSQGKLNQHIIILLLSPILYLPPGTAISCHFYFQSEEVLLFLMLISLALFPMMSLRVLPSFCDIMCQIKLPQPPPPPLCRNLP
jgi:hypothetical protein